MIPKPHKRQILLIVVTVLCLITITANAQFQFPEGLDHYEVQFGEYHLSWDFHTYDPATGLTNFTLTISGPSGTHSRTFTVNCYADYETDPGWQDYVNWATRIIGGMGTGGFATEEGVVTAPADPLVNSSMQTFRALIFSDRVEPRVSRRDQREADARAADQKEAEVEKGVSKAGQIMRMSRLQQPESDIQHEFFKFSGNAGSNFNLSGGYNMTIPGISAMGGGRLTINVLKFEDVDAYTNGFMSLYGKKQVMEKEGFDIYAGGNLNFQFLDQDYSNKNGFGIGLMAAGKKALASGHLVTFGMMYNMSMLDKSTIHYQSFGGMYGLPVGSQMTLSGDILAIWTMAASYDGSSTDIASPLVINAGVSTGLYISEMFSLNGGFRTTMLADEYSNFVIRVGAVMMF